MLALLFLIFFKSICFNCLNLYKDPNPKIIGAHKPQNIMTLIPARSSLNIELNHPYTKGAGKYPKQFLMIYPVELPNARRYGGTEAIIIPVRPGIIAPPKNRTIHKAIAE